VAISYMKQVKLVSHAGDCHARKLARNDGVEKFSWRGLLRRYAPRNTRYARGVRATRSAKDMAARYEKSSSLSEKVQKPYKER